MVPPLWESLVVGSAVFRLPHYDLLSLVALLAEVQRAFFRLGDFDALQIVILNRLGRYSCHPIRYLPVVLFRIADDV